MLRTALGPAIAGYLEDPSIVEVMLNPDGRLWIDRLSGGLEDTGHRVAPADAERIVRLGDPSPEGMGEKARFVLGEMERRMTALGFGWADVTATQVYTVHDIHPFLADEIVRRGAARAGLTWHYARPPVQGLDYEMDVRGLARELVI